MEEKEYDLSQLNESESWLLLFLVLLESEKEVDRQIREFEAELIYHNRFTSNHTVVDELHKYAPYAKKEIKAGTLFYRGRVFQENNIDKLVKCYLNEHGSTKEQIKEILEKWDNENKALLLLQDFFNAEGDIRGLFGDKEALGRAYTKWKKNTRFKGYNAIQSTAPEADKVVEGRANPAHIRYLYLCEDPLTPVYEVRASINDDVSVAKFKLLKDIAVYDLKKENTKKYDAEGSNPELFDALSALYSRPYKEKKEGYIATQFLAEEIKNMGFDGLRHESSLHSGGYNIVLFNPDICKPVSSDVVHVQNIEITTEAPWYKQLADSINIKQ